MTDVRVAVIGLGHAAVDMHLPGLGVLDGVSVVGGFDLDAQSAARAKERHAIETYETVEALLESTRPDVVVVATPPDSHAEYCLRALHAGAHVICEKPFVASVAEADRVLAAAATAGRRVAVNHEFREMPIFRAVRDRVAGSGVGDLVTVQAWQLMDLPPWLEAAAWRSNLTRRSLYEGGIHLIDFVMSLFGEKPVAVSAAVSGCGQGSGESDAVASVTLQFSRGRLAHVHQNRLCRGETQYLEVRADCAQASLRASFGGRARVSMGLHRSTKPHLRMEYGVSGLAWIEHGHRRAFIERNPKEPAMVATRLLLERTLRAFRDGSEPPASGQVGRDVLEVIAACYRSAEQGRRIDLGAGGAEGLETMNLAAVTG